jgi:GNAT superfamily N-acetyltransferase
MDDENILSFTSQDIEHTLIKDLVRSQGFETCREEISLQYIKNVIHEYDFGLARITQKANVGKKHTRKSGDKFQLWGFLLCRLNKNTKIATIEIVCSRRGAQGTGRLLIEILIEKLKSQNIAQIVRLLCLPKDKLRAFYKTMGFQQETIHVPEPTMKLYEMTFLL